MKIMMSFNIKLIKINEQMEKETEAMERRSKTPTGPY